MVGRSKIDYFTIIFSKTMPIYSPGEPINGTVSLRLNERMSINGLRLVIDGKARVNWVVVLDDRENYSRKGMAEENYMHIVIDLIKKDGLGDVYIEAGEHSYPFNALLPATLPTSFEHPNGQIRYVAYATLDISWSFNKHTMRSFTLVNSVDLNAMPNLRLPQTVNSSTEVGCAFFCMSSLVNVSFSIKKGGFVPGEAILFNAFIENQSMYEISQITVKLIQSVRLYGKQPGVFPPLTQHLHRTMYQAEMARVMASIRYPGRKSAESQLRWDNGVLFVPPLCPYLNKLCGIIEVNYFLRLDYNEGNDTYMSDELAIPIVIGTIPLVNGSSITEYQQPIASSSQPPSAPPIWHSSSLQPQPNFTYRPSELDNRENMISTPPPPYNDLNKGEIIESDQKSFVPQYPFYNDPKATK